MSLQIKRDTDSIRGWCVGALFGALCLVTPGRAAAFVQGIDISSARLHEQQGVSYLNQHNLPRALDEFRAVLQIEPNNAAAHDFLGVTLAESGRTEDAADEFKEAVRISDDLVQAHFHLALAYDRLARTSEAVSEYETALRLAPNLIDARYALSADCWKLGDWDGAIQLLRQILKQNPSFTAELHYNLGLELKQAGKLDDAAGELKTATELQPDSVKSYLALSQVLTEKLDLSGAIAAAKSAIELRPDAPESHYDLAEALRVKGDLDAAEAQYNHVLLIDPQYPGAHRQLGLVLRQKGLYDVAAAQLQDAAQQNREDAEAWYYLGTAQLKLNDVSRAIKNLTESVRLDPYDSGAHIALAGALNRLGKAQDATQELEKAQTIDKLKADAGRSRILLGSAVEHLNHRDVDSALEDLRQAAELSPEYPEVQYRLARVLEQKGVPHSEVERILRRATDLKPDYAQAHLELGLVLKRMDRTADAANEFRRASALAPSLIEAHRELAISASAAHDWPAAIAEFNAIIAWDKDDHDARQNLTFALAQLRSPPVP